MPLVEIDLAHVSSVPPDAVGHGNRAVVVTGEPWLLVASRTHPRTGVVNGLLVSPDGKRAAVAPMEEVRDAPVWVSRVEEQEPAGVFSERVDAAAKSLAKTFDGAVVALVEQELELPPGSLQS